MEMSAKFHGKPIASPEMPRLSPDILLLAKRLSESSFESFEITPDMVGETLLYKGDLHLVEPKKGDILPDYLVEPVVEASPETCVQSDTLEIDQAFGHGFSGQKSFWSGEHGPDYGNTDRGFISKADLLNVLKEFPDKWFSTSIVADLIWKERGYRTFESCQASMYKFFEALLKDGKVEEKTEGRSRFFRALPAQVDAGI